VVHPADILTKNKERRNRNDNVDSRKLAKNHSPITYQRATFLKLAYQGELQKIFRSMEPESQPLGNISRSG